MPSQNVTDPAYFKEAQGTVTLQYPHESIAVPDHGRYRLHNEMDDCIVCDKCAKICPVDCIDIEPIKATEQVGVTSDGSPIRLYAAKFDIDMAKCCYCGLCTTVCPTECLTMTKAYDFAEFDVKDFNYHYATLSPEMADEKKKLYEQFVAEKEALKAQKSETKEAPTVLSSAKPVFKPSFVKKEKPADEASLPKDAEPAKPKFVPAFKAKNLEKNAEQMPENAEVTSAKPKFVPAFRAKPSEAKPAENTNEPLDNKADSNMGKVAEDKPKPKFVPSFKPKASESATNTQENPTAQAAESAEAPKPKPKFVPSFKPKASESAANTQESPTEQAAESAEAPKPKPKFVPSFKPKAIENATSEPVNSTEQAPESAEAPKPKPKFTPTFKPKS